MRKLLISLLLLSSSISAINSAFFIPTIVQENFFAFGVKGNFDTQYYFYKPSPLKFSVPALEGNLKLGKRASFNIKYEYLVLDRSELESSDESIKGKSNAELGENYVLGGGDIVTSVQFNLEQIKLENTDLLIETKWPNAEYEAGFGTDMTDLNFRFVNTYFYNAYHTTLNFGMKVLGDPTGLNTQADYYTFGATFQYADFVASFNEDIGRYDHHHALADFRVKYQYKYLQLKAGISYADTFVNKMFEIGMIID